MHIGGMRTALFNWLWARHCGGQFILRIDDTDQQRNIDAALAPILEAFRWLGLNWDEGPEVGGPYGPYFQSQRTELYRIACEKLMTEGKAYKDFDPPEITQADREAAEKEKRPFLNVRRSLDLSPAQVEQLEAEGHPYVIRLLVDRSRRVNINDHIRGHVEWDCGLIPDPVIMRANGSPLYNFASVVDDAHLQISHVIRAEEHLTNTAVQVMLFEALGYDLPEFAHIPFVAAPGTKEKLSKRDKKLEKYRKSPQFKRLFEIGDVVLAKIGRGARNKGQEPRESAKASCPSPLDVRSSPLDLSETLNPVMVAYYEAVGFLPEAVLNGLARLGWSFDDKTENMSLDFIVEHFTLDRVVKAPAGLDPDKLLAYQEYWMGQRSLEEKIEGCLPYLVRAGLMGSSFRTDDHAALARVRAYLDRLITALGERLKLFSDILGYDEYFVADEDLVYDEKAFEKRIRQPENARSLLMGLRDELAAADAFDAASLETLFKNWLERKDIAIGDVIHALRIAVTGKPAGPGMFECLELLGKERCLNRIERAARRA